MSYTKEQLVEEEEYLHVRLHKLFGFINQSKTYDNLHEDVKISIQIQRGAMNAHLGALQQRIARINKYTENRECEIDWSKVPVNTTISVWNDPGADTSTRSFICVANGLFICFPSGQTQENSTGVTEWWKYCKLHPDVTTQKHWRRKS